ncbi:MAG: tRNA-processing RNAse [Geobacteraceae bacterium]|nr:tRNA-processing RNAse [Geobacteraceae bacterium]
MFFGVPLPGKLLEADPECYSGLKRFYIRGVRIIFGILQHFHDNNCLLRASSLSFTTILSLVPFFAFAFAVLKGLGVHNMLEPFIIGRLTAGSQEIANKILVYIDNTKMGSIGALGLAALIVTVITLLGNVEETFNNIWGVRETRSFGRKFSDYVSVVVSAPILLLVATSITTSLQSQSLLIWLLEREYLGDFILLLFEIVPYASIWLALVFLYIFIPNVRVRFGSALIGGLFAGISWQVAQWGYIHFQVGVSKYNAIYGTLSALPVFMVWIYASWVIVLLGVEVVYAHQNRKTFLNDIHRPTINYASWELTSLVVLLAAADSHYRDKQPWTCERLAGETGIPAAIVKEVLQRLVDEGYLAATEGEIPAYLPARPLEHMRVHQIIEHLKNHGESCRIQGVDKICDVARHALAVLGPGVSGGEKGLTIQDLVLQLSSDEPVR